MKNISTIEQKAKKEHICDYCGIKIKVGEIYENQTNVVDNELYHWKSHLVCLKVAEKLEMFDYSTCDEGLSNEDFHEGVREYLHSNRIVYSGWEDAMRKVQTSLGIGDKRDE